MNEIKQYRPNYCDFGEVQTTTFETVEDLIALPFVSNFCGIKNFCRFSTAESCGKYILMAEYDGGYEWWVVGYLKNPVSELPVWKAKYKN